jgi:glycosyltransferase involved in cell wall biosynthesis
MEIDYINGSRSKKMFGMSRYEMEINKRIEDVQFNRIEYHPLMERMENTYNLHSSPKDEPKTPPKHASSTSRIPKSVMDAGWSLVSHIDRYRYQKIVRKKVKEGNIKHITFQDLAYLSNSIKLEKSIINCHDLIPWAYDHNRTSLWKNNIKGLKKADKIITVSRFSKNEIIKHLNYPEENVHIIPDAVDHQRYQPQTEAKILEKHRLDGEQRYILYVGSETPRMNLELLLKALNKLKNLLPKVKLLKIGESQSYQARNKTLSLINSLKLNEDVILLGYVPEEDLPSWYNIADVLVYPCLYAGFGLPPLEAMACGTPVITSNTSSLPEVVGDAGVMIDPDNENQLMVKLYEILTMARYRNKIIKKGITRSKLFTWTESARKTLEVYEDLN